MSAATGEGGSRSELKDWVGLAARLVLGVVLLVAGLLKITALGSSRTATRAYELMPVDIANFVGTLLPIAEIVLGVLLIIGLLTRGSALLGGLLMLAFIAGITSAWARGLTIDCGCFGGGGSVAANKTKYLQEILRDSGLALCAAWLVLRPRSRWSLDGRLWG